MFENMLEGLRKAAESSLQTQQDMLKQWAQQWPQMPLSTTGLSAEGAEALQKRWLESVTDALRKNRELLDSAYQSGIQLIEQTFRISEAKSPEDFRRLLEDLWRKMAETTKQQTETQLLALMSVSEKWLDLVPKPKEQGKQ